MQTMLPRDLRSAGFIDSSGAIQFNQRRMTREFDDSYTQAMTQKLNTGNFNSNRSNLSQTSDSRRYD